MNCFEFNWDWVYGRNNTIIVGEAFCHKPFTGFPDRMVRFFFTVNSTKAIFQRNEVMPMTHMDSGYLVKNAHPNRKNYGNDTNIEFYHFKNNKFDIYYALTASSIDPSSSICIPPIFPRPVVTFNGHTFLPSFSTIPAFYLSSL